jgi:hypothetical protein
MTQRPHSTLRLLTTLCLAASLWLPAAHAQDTQPAEAPNQFRNLYKSSVYGLTVTVTHELIPLDDNRHKLRFFADSLVASIEETSTFSSPEGELLQPERYTYDRTGLGRNRKARITFDWDTGKVVNNVNDKPWQMQVPKGTQDKVSFQVQLQRDLIAGKTDNLTYTIADGGKTKVYQFAIMGKETLTTPLGKVDTVKVKRTRKDSDRVTYVWMAPRFSYLLVRMQQEEDGDVYTINIDQAEIDGKEISSF